MLIGSHVENNSPDYLVGSIKETIRNGGNSLMFYFGAPQNFTRTPIRLQKVEEAKILAKENNIDLINLICHAPYIISPSSDALTTSGEKKCDVCERYLKSEIERMDALGAKYIVLHPGYYADSNLDIACSTIARTLDKLFYSTPDSSVSICLETMAGKGTEVGSKFQEIAKIRKLMKHKERVFVCFDTCHTFDAGYDLKNNYEDVINKLDEIIGIDNVKVIHLNDSKNPSGSHKDRHENIGMGYIGFDTLYKISNDPRFSQVPKILETPYRNEINFHQQEISSILNNIPFNFLK
jgi:deoxyribonuclease-4